MKLVGLSGKIGVGKSALAEKLLRLAPGGARLAFGDPVKSECAAASGFPVEWAYCPRCKLRIVPPVTVEGFAFPEQTVRERLQAYGTDFRRAQSHNYWTDAWARTAAALSAKWIVADDVRFPNEADAILAQGGILIRLDPYPGWTPGPFAGHVSETALDRFSGFTTRLAPLYGELDLIAQTVAEQFVSQGDLAMEVA